MNRAPGKNHKPINNACTLMSLACLLLSTAVMAQPQTVPPQFYYPGMPPPAPWIPQPQVPQPAQPAQTAPAPAPVTVPATQPGLPPQYPGAPLWNNPWQQQPAQYYNVPWQQWQAPTAPVPQQLQQTIPTVSAPYLETSIEGTQAYVHQNLVVTVKVVSQTTLKTANLEMSDNEDVILRQLGEITAETRSHEGTKEIVNTIYYLLTPLRSGELELEPLHIIGTMDNGAGYEISYDAVADRAIHLSIFAPAKGAQTWLPLHQLELNAALSNDEQLAEGEPISLTVEQRAIGMSGTQLPSLESQLQAPGHRLYLEKTDYDGVITRDGKLLGTRIDRFTLVPQSGNEVKIPALRVEWWNVDRHRKETAVLPGRVLNEGENRLDNETDSDSWLHSSVKSTLLWLLLLAVAFMLGRQWKRIEPRLQRSGKVLWQWLEIGSRPARQRLGALLIHLSPRRNMHRVRRWVANSLPRSARMWFCVRNADDEQDPDDWSQVLRFLVNRRLGLSANLPMPRLADYIIEIHPWADADRIRTLLAELEATLFSKHKISDFDHWKKEFKQQIRPHFSIRLWQHRKRRTDALPGLNPGIG